MDEICRSFDKYLEVKNVLLDISKAFYKAWHDGIILRLKMAYQENERNERKNRLVPQINF